VRFDSLVHDVRYALRTLRRAPLFAATVTATMGLGLGLLGSAFTLINAYILKPIDLPDPRELYRVSRDTRTAPRQRFSLADFEALQPAARPLADVAAAHDVTVMQNAVATTGLLVSGNYFELLGAQPALGRLLRADDAAVRGGAAVAVLSHQIWRARFGADPAIVGQRITLGSQRFEVVGVTQPYAHLAGQELVAFWAPLTMAGAFAGTDPAASRDVPSLALVGRLRDGVDEASLRAWLDVWLARRTNPASDEAPVAAHLDSLATRLPLNGATLTLAMLIMSGFGLVLLVASANVTNLMLARGLARQPEIAVRLALGASRWRVVRQLIVESLVLAVPAAAAGLALTAAAARVFPAVVLATFPAGLMSIDNILVPLEPDWRVLTVLFTAAILSASLVALAPAGRLAATRLASASRGEASTDTRRSRLRSGLVAMQVGACALFLVAAAGLLEESARLANLQPNLRYDGVSLVRIDPAMRAAVARRLQSDPAVEQVAIAAKPPLMGPLPTARMTASLTGVAQSAGYMVVSPEYFPMFDVQVVRGRTFTPAEAAGGTAVALVSEATAAAMWPGLDPLGQTLDLAPAANERPDPRLPRGRVRVIGVTEDVGNGSILEGLDASCVYLPASLEQPGELSLLVRARTDAAGALHAATATAVRDVAPDTPFQVASFLTLVGAAAWIFQAFSVAASVLAVVGLIFAYSGTHAVVSFLLAQRRREFGVRMALGASTSRIGWGMLAETTRIGAIGVAVGLGIAAGFLRLFGGSIAIVPEVGARPFLAGAAIVLVATVIAALVPLRMLARIDPAQALRTG